MNNNHSDAATILLAATSSARTPTWMVVLACCLAGGVFVVGGIGNLTIILLTALNKQLRTKQHIFFVALSVSDLIITTITTPPKLQTYVLGHWPHSRVWCRIYTVILAAVFSSCLIFVALIARDRMLMVTKGAAYDAYESGRRKLLYVAIIIITLPIVLISYTSLDIFTGFSVNALTGSCVPEQIQNLYVIIVNQLLFTMAPFAFMLYYYTRVRRYMLLKRRQQQTVGLTVQVAPAASNTTTSTALQTAAAATNTTTTILIGKVAPVEYNTHRAVKIMNVLLVTTFTTSLPAAFTTIAVNILMANPTLVEPRTFAWWLDFNGLSYFMCYFAHAIDPILYAYAVPSYRAALAKLLRCAQN